jgi:hypothetical protein
MFIIAPISSINSIEGYIGRRVVIVSSFGTNPVSGGRPLIDKIIKEIRIVEWG